MGFNSVDAMVTALTAGQKWRAPFNKITTAATTGTAGRAYDFTTLAGQPLQAGHGEHLINSYAPATLYNWTANGTGWAASANVIAKTNGTGTTLTADSQARSIVAGRYYRVQMTVSAWTSSNCFFTLGGVTGTNRAGTGTFVEIITAASTAGFVLNASASSGVWSVSNISVVEWGASSGDAPMFNPVTQTTFPSLYHGGDVSTDTKHLLTVGAMTTAATGVGNLIFYDVLGSYPYINSNSTSTQTCYNTETLPRYTDGAGVKAILVSRGTGYAANATTVGATPGNINFLYTNSAGTGSRQVPITTATTASGFCGQVSHSGVAANNYPYIPWAHGDSGVRSVQSFWLGTGSGTANTYYDLVLVRELTNLPIPAANVYYERNLFSESPSGERIVDGAVISAMHIAGGALAASTTFIGHIEVGWD